MILQSDSHSQPVSYCSYLVRLWREQPGTAWRAAAQNVQTGEIVRFASIDSLCCYLTDHATDSGDPQVDERAADRLSTHLVWGGVRAAQTLPVTDSMEDS